MRLSLWTLALVAIVAGQVSSALAQPAPPPGPQLTEDEVMARFKHEPSVQQVQEAAIRYYQVHPDRIRSLRNNAQLKALVPTLSGGFSNYVNSTKRKLVDALYIGLPSQWKEDEAINGDSIGFSVTATWNLDRLVFNAEVLDVQSLIGILDGVVREVTTVYYIRRRLQIDNVLRPPTDLASKISQSIRIEELTGLLDAMTGGFMSRAVRKGAVQGKPVDQAMRSPALVPVKAAVAPAPRATH